LNCWKIRSKNQAKEGEEEAAADWSKYFRRIRRLRGLEKPANNPERSLLAVPLNSPLTLHVPGRSRQPVVESCASPAAFI
jgi:hypothetical protein